MLNWQTIITMLLSVQAYAFFYNYNIAIALTVLILMHEVGHKLLAHQFNIRTSPPFFLPFFGAFVTILDKPKNDFENAMISFGGPAAGLVGSLILLPIYFYVEPLHQSQIALIIYLNSLINLFNLMPFSRLDGDLFTKPLKGWHLLVIACMLTSAPILFYLKKKQLEILVVSFIAILLGKAILKLTSQKRKKSILERLRSKEPEENNPLTLTQTVVCFSCYFLTSLVLAILVLLTATHR